ncbi:hypothetical protein ANN_18554 [Periplaneta americana]|uniref:Uncharacterized protein n=1 Tax=Periplaneta americana TaxID=6978 RepID=A0ABQ8SQF4_PERAM|nr:hypothetical protein ANN_18554 [Periplaneta americana]
MAGLCEGGNEPPGSLKARSLDKLGSANIDSSDQINVPSLRKLLRDKEFDSWCTLPPKGKGVILYKEYTPGNKWLCKPNGLTSSEWKAAIKMTANVCPVRALPGRSQSEKETLAHILGACPHGELLRNSRHHKIRSLLASALRGKDYKVEEEVHGSSTNGSSRRIDIISIPTRSTSGFIIDPTVRVETYENQPGEVHQEKCDIYDPTIPYYKEKYHLTSIEVIGLLIGARGTITKRFAHFCKKFDLGQTLVTEISLSAVKGSIKILRNHLYTRGGKRLKLQAATCGNGPKLFRGRGTKKSEEERERIRDMESSPSPEWVA